MASEVDLGNPGISCVPKIVSYVYEVLSFSFLSPYHTPFSLLHIHVPISCIQQLYSGPTVDAKSRQHPGVGYFDMFSITTLCPSSLCVNNFFWGAAGVSLSQVQLCRPVSTGQHLQWLV